VKDYFKKNKFEPDITHGVCPTCDMPTMLVSLTKDHYRCITCGSDLEQKINGVIKYIPVAQLEKENKPEA
jgi:transposase-like protein